MWARCDILGRGQTRLRAKDVGEGWNRGADLGRANVMNFGEALVELKAGNKVRRSIWEARGMFLFMAVVTSIGSLDGAPMGISNVRPCIVLRDAQGKCVPGWHASITDLLAEDWELVG